MEHHFYLTLGEPVVPLGQGSLAGATDSLAPDTADVSPFTPAPHLAKHIQTLCPLLMQSPLFFGPIQPVHAL